MLAASGVVGQVRWALTDRLGGRSAGPYAALNLGAHVGDDLGAVQENRALLAEALGLATERLVLMEQVHGRDVARVESRPADPPRADALVSTTVELGLVVQVADCTPVVLAEVDGPAFGVLHAGRVGMMSGVVEATVTALRDLGSGPLTAVVGPSVCARCYEVPADLAEQAAAVSPVAAARSWSGGPAIDVAGAVVDQLRGLDVAVRWLAGCTREDDRFYSHRRDGRTGRFAMVAFRPGSERA